MKAHHLLLSTALLGAAGYGALTLTEQPAAKNAAPQAPPAPIVSITPVQEKPLADVEDFTGRVEAPEWVEIRPRVAGHIVAVQFEAGQMVKKGDVLFQIDDRWHKAAADAADAALARAEADVHLAQLDAARTSSLMNTRAVSREENDSRVSKLEVAQAMLLAARAAREAAHLDLDYTSVRSPIDGKVSRALLTVGNYVNGPANVVTTVVSTGAMHVYADLDETSYLRLQQLLKKDPSAKHVEVRLADDAIAPLTGQIEHIDNRLNPNSGSILMRINVPNTDNILTPGLFVRVRVPLSSEAPSLLVDESSVGTDQSQKFVLVVNEKNEALYRSVKLGPVVDGKRVIRSGLKEGEKIIVNGLQRVRPGIVVKPEMAQAKAAESSNHVAAR